MAAQTPAKKAELAFLVLTASFLPSLSLVALGALCLWEKGYVLPWSLAALTLVGTIYGAQRWALRVKPDARDQALDVDNELQRANAPIEADLAPANQHGALGKPSVRAPISNEELARADVASLAKTARIDDLLDQQRAWALTSRTIAVVARRLHPQHSSAIWQFTVPEALAISEQVSKRLGAFVITHVPFGERLTVSQMLTIYRARSIVDLAGRAYDIWRIVRLANPATGMASEARERLTKALVAWGHEHVTRQIVEAYVEEVGRAAIDLYSGKLRVQAGQPVVDRKGAELDEPTNPRAPGVLKQTKAMATAVLRRFAPGKK